MDLDAQCLGALDGGWHILAIVVAVLRGRVTHEVDEADGALGRVGVRRPIHVERCVQPQSDVLGSIAAAVGKLLAHRFSDNAKVTSERDALDRLAIANVSIEHGAEANVGRRPLVLELRANGQNVALGVLNLSTSSTNTTSARCGVGSCVGCGTMTAAVKAIIRSAATNDAANTNGNTEMRARFHCVWLLSNVELERRQVAMIGRRVGIPARPSVASGGGVPTPGACP